MISSLGLEVSGLIDPHLNWKTASKTKPRAGRRARTSFAGIIDGKPSTKPGAESRKNPVRAETMITNEMAVAESEKVGVAILGQRFGDVVLESIPIKKRRFLIRSPSPPPPSPPPPPPCPAIREKTEQNSSKARRPIASSANINGPSTGIKRKFGDCVDFSGISILAAAACGTVTLDSELPPTDKSGAQATTTTECDGTNTESTSNLTEDSLSSLLVITNNNSSGESVWGRGMSSRDDRLHWDLNKEMEAWKYPSHDEEKLPKVEDSVPIGGNSESAGFSPVSGAKAIDQNHSDGESRSESTTASQLEKTDFCGASNTNLPFILPIISHVPRGLENTDATAEEDGKSRSPGIMTTSQEEKNSDLCLATNADLLHNVPFSSDVIKGIEKNTELAVEGKSSSRHEDGESWSQATPADQAGRTIHSGRDCHADFFRVIPTVSNDSKGMEKTSKRDVEESSALYKDDESRFQGKQAAQAEKSNGVCRGGHADLLCIVSNTSHIPQGTEKKTEAAAEEESSSQYEDGEFRESIIHGWGINDCEEGETEECVDYGSDDIGEEEAPTDFPAPPPDCEPNSDVEASGWRMEKSCPNSGNSSVGVTETDKEEMVAAPISRRVRLSGWDRLPGDGSGQEPASGSALRRLNLSSDPARDRPHDRAYFHRNRQNLEMGRSVRRERFFPRDAAAASIAKVESNGFVVAPDGTILGAPPPVTEFPPQRFRSEIRQHRQPRGGSPFYRRDRSFSPAWRSPSPSRSPQAWRRRRSRSPDEPRQGRPRALAPPPRWAVQRSLDGANRRWPNKFFYRPGPVDRYQEEDFGRNGGAARFRFGFRHEEKDKTPYFRPDFSPRRRRHP
ncbi:dentin sialophosphoprotein-like protein isoform X2 [Wolffia australiana]